MGAAAGPCPVWRPRAPGPGLALTPWPPLAGERGRPGDGAGRGRGRPSSQRCEAWTRGWSLIRGGVQAPTPGPELRGAEPVGGHGARAGHPSAAFRVGRGVGAPRVQATAPSAPARGEPRDPEVHFRGYRSVASVSALARLLRDPAQGEGRKEQRAASQRWRMRPTSLVETRKRKT